MQREAFFDDAASTAEQRFMIMLNERLEKVEDLVSKHESTLTLRTIHGLPEHARKICEKSIDLYDRIVKKQNAVETDKLKDRLPEHIYRQVPDTAKSYFLSTIDTMQSTSLSPRVILFQVIDFLKALTVRKINVIFHN